MIVTLDAGEMTTARTLAAMRNAVNRAAKVTDARRDKAMSDLALDEIGLIAEIAWCKAFNCYPDLTVAPRKGGCDMVTRGYRIDIKASTNPNARLLARPNKTSRDTDFYVLGVVSDATVDFKGYARSTELLDERNLIDLGHGLTFAMRQNQLHSFKNAEALTGR